MSILDLQVGNIVDIDGDLYKVNEIETGYNRVNVKLENIETKDLIEKTFNSFSEINIVEIVDKKMQFSYLDGKLYYFMDIETYQQLALTEEMVKDYMKYIVEDAIVTMSFVRDKMIGVTLPDEVELIVAEEEKSLDNAKTVILETGHSIEVPKTIIVGDKIKINTKTDQFVEVVNKI